jgi:hypothetical protein
MARPINLFLFSNYAKSSGMVRCWVRVSTWDARPTLPISKQLKKNVNDRSHPMFNWPDFWHDLKINLGFQSKPQPSLLALGIHWTNNVKWIPRLVAYRQLDNWTSTKHTNP